MSGVELSPSFSAELAANVYLIKDEFSRKGFTLKYKNQFNMEASTMAKGKTGGLLVVKKAHVMAFMAEGINEHKGQAFVAIKGTASLYDALTDLNTGVKSSHTGASVHQGFYYAFDSILGELKQFLGSLRGVGTVHCVGHSLGGAIATLAADWIKASGQISTVKLYSFGCPRVGMDFFASKCTSRLSADNIYRMYHSTDPVPMVPMWPFTHVPTSHADYLMYSPISPKPWEYHLMKHYISSAGKAKSWSAIKHCRPISRSEAAIQRWLKSDGIISFGANSLALLGEAIIYVLKKVAHIVGVAVQGAFATQLTLLDRLAMLLAKAAEVAVEVSVWVYHLVKKMAKLIGVTIKEGANLTVSFIRAVLMRVHQKISEMIWQAGQHVGK